MDLLGNILCAVIGSGITLVGVIYKDISDIKKYKIDYKYQAINDYLYEAGRLINFPAMNSRYTAAFTKASVYFDKTQIQLSKEFETAVNSKNQETSRDILIKLTDSLKSVFC